MSKARGPVRRLSNANWGDFPKTIAAENSEKSDEQNTNAARWVRHVRLHSAETLKKNAERNEVSSKTMSATRSDNCYHALPRHPQATGLVLKET